MEYHTLHFLTVMTVIVMVFSYAAFLLHVLSSIRPFFPSK